MGIVVGRGPLNTASSCSVVVDRGRWIARIEGMLSEPDKPTPARERLFSGTGRGLLGSSIGLKDSLIGGNGVAAERLRVGGASTPPAW